MYTVHERESRHTRLRLERDVNKEQHRRSNKSYGTLGGQQSQPGATAKSSGPSYESYSRTTQDQGSTIKEFVWQHGTINLDWYVPDLCNTRVSDLIKKRLQLETMEGRILFRSPALSEFFKTSNFELNLKTGGVFTYLDPPEDIGIKCQKEPFNLEFLRDTLRGEQDTGTIQEERLKRIPSVKKLAGPADVMPREEAEYKVRQYCHL